MESSWQAKNFQAFRALPVRCWGHDGSPHSACGIRSTASCSLCIPRFRGPPSAICWANGLGLRPRIYFLPISRIFAFVRAAVKERFGLVISATPTHSAISRFGGERPQLLAVQPVISSLQVVTTLRSDVPTAGSFHDISVFLVARGLRVLPRFARFCRGRY